MNQSLCHSQTKPTTDFKRYYADYPLPNWMKTDKNLTTLINLDANFQPLENIVHSLSKQTKLKIEVDKSLQDYRLSIYAKNQPLHIVLWRIAQLFGHGSYPYYGCYWRVLDEVKPSSVIYFLSRITRSFQEEAEQLDIPKQTILRWLKDLRDFALLPEEKKKTFQTDCPCLKTYVKHAQEGKSNEDLPYLELFRTFSDEDIQTLANTRRLVKENFSFSKEAAQLFVDTSAGNQSASVPSTNQITNSSSASLYIQGGMLPVGRGVFDMVVSKGNAYNPSGFVFDTLKQMPTIWTEQESLSISNQDSYSKINLKKVLQGKVTKQNTVSFEEVISAIGQLSGIELYAEIFIKHRIRLDEMQGTPEQLLSVSCFKAGYHWRKVGDAYFVYSKTWAFDRRDNIPQKKIDEWDMEAQKSSEYTLNILIDMARMSDYQLDSLYITHNFQLLPPQRSCLRLLGLLSKNNLKASFSSKGTNLPKLNPKYLELARKVLGFEPTEPLNMSISPHPYSGHISVGTKGYNMNIKDNSGRSVQYPLFMPSFPRIRKN